jgi:hypothetical protein
VGSVGGWGGGSAGKDLHRKNELNTHFYRITKPPAYTFTLLFELMSIHKQPLVHSPSVVHVN